MADAVKTLTARLEAVSARLAAVEAQLAAGGGGGSAPASGGAVEPSKALSEFDDLVRQYIDQYVQLSAKINPIVKEQADLVKQAVSAHREFLGVAAKAKKPADSVFLQLVKPTSDLILQVIALRDKNRAHSHFNYLSTLSEGISALGWVAVSPTPGPHVDESRSSSEFYSNKLLMQYRHDQSEDGKTQVAWVAAWNTFLKDLRQWIKNYHTTGLTWNPSGADASSFVGKSSSSTTSSSGSSGAGAPPPPGPPPPMDLDFSTPSTKSGGGSHAALFAEINAVKDRQTGGKTAGLRTVTKEMKSKYQDKSTLAPAPTSSTSSASAPKKTSAAPAKPPKFALEGNKWVVENQVGNKEIVIENPEPRQTVYIYKCDNSVVQIKGKVNAITVDSCKKTGIVFENAISSAEVVNCISIQIQVTGKVPSIQVDKTSGCQIFLSAESLETELVTSKSDEMNVCLPGVTPSDDMVEMAVPEQFKTVIVNRKLVTEAVAHV